MGIFTRFSDKAEDPEKIIRMVIQEMEDTLVEVRTSAARAIADQKDVERKVKKLSHIQADWESKAELALSKDRDDLAKGALVEKAKAADMASHLDEELSHLKEALARHEDDVVKLEAKLREARAKKATLDARHKTATSHVRVRRNLYNNRIEDAFSKFDKIDARIDRLEGEAEAYEMGKGRDLAGEIADLEAEEAIQSELDALKSKMKKPAAAPKKSAAKK